MVLNKKTGSITTNRSRNRILTPAIQNSKMPRWESRLNTDSTMLNRYCMTFMYLELTLTLDLTLTSITCLVTGYWPQQALNNRTLLWESRLNTDSTMLNRYDLYDLQTDLDLYNIRFDLDPSIASRNRILTHQIRNNRTPLWGYRPNIGNTMLNRYDLYDLKTDLDLINLRFDLDPKIAAGNWILTWAILKIQTKYRQNHAKQVYDLYSLTVDLGSYDL